MTLINISRFIDEERPYFEATEAIISMDDEELLHPDKKTLQSLAMSHKKLIKALLKRDLLEIRML